ncbi:MAG: hypothetical protein QME12_04240 [Nanoarchaeota archaeon]|nr:hypothetical protein [Nanoarchaeota archaeon]
MAPENRSRGDYFSRLNALYETLDIVLYPMPKKLLNKDYEEKFVLDPGFAPQIDEIEEDNRQTYGFRGCIYFEKLNEKQQKAVKEALEQYNSGPDNFLILPPRFCKNEKKCPGHHYLEDRVANAIPEDLSYCYLYFFA